MRKAIKPPSEWLRLLCKDWAHENEILVENADSKFMEYKPYLKGMLSSQLLCRLSLQSKEGLDGTQAQIDFWRILGIEDEFDKSYIIAQVERFNLLYNVRGNAIEDDAGGLFSTDYVPTDPAGGLNVSPGGYALPPYMDQTATAVAAAAVAAADMQKYGAVKKLSPDSGKLLGKDSEADRKQSYKAEQRRITQERKEQRQRDKELLQLRKAQERAAREQSREERRRKKVEIREQRETFAKEQKKAALRRAEDLVKSNRVPIEITRGAAAAKAAANAALVAGGASVSSGDESQPTGMKKPRSAIVVSTAGDLHMVCYGSFRDTTAVPYSVIIVSLTGFIFCRFARMQRISGPSTMRLRKSTTRRSTGSLWRRSLAFTSKLGKSTVVW